MIIKKHSGHDTSEDTPRKGRWQVSVTQLLLLFQYLLRKADRSIDVPGDLRHILMHLSSSFLVEEVLDLP